LDRTLVVLQWFIQVIAVQVCIGVDVVGVGVVKFVIILIYIIFRIATVVPYSESPRQIFESGPSLIKIQCDLICFRSKFWLTCVGVQSSQCPQHFNNCTFCIIAIFRFVSFISFDFFSLAIEIAICRFAILLIKYRSSTVLYSTTPSP
jgi:hypothetical protein